MQLDLQPGRQAPQIAVFLNGFADDYQNTLCKGIASQADAKGYSVFFFSTNIEFEVTSANRGELNVLNLPKKNQFAGIIVATNTFPAAQAGEYYKKFLKMAQGIPVVSIGSPMDGTYHVDIRENGCMEALVRHIVEEHACQNVAYVSGPMDNVDSMQRLQAFQTVLRENNLPIDNDRIYLGDFNREQGRLAAAYFLDCGKPWPRAILCANDAMAMGVYAELAKRGVRIPDDIIVTGYDFTREAQYSHPQLTSVRVPLYEMGQKAVDIIHTARTGSNPAPSYLFDAEVMSTASCGCAGITRKSTEEIIHEMMYVDSGQRTCSTVSAAMMTLLCGEYTEKDIIDNLTDFVRLLNLNQFYLCLNDGDRTAPADTPADQPATRLLLGYDNGQVLRNQRFPAQDLLPVLKDGRQCTLVFSPLYHRNHSFGYLAYDPSGKSSYVQNILVRNIRLALENLRVQNMLKDYSRQLEELNLRDPLTGTYNRRGLERHAGALLAVAERERKLLSIIFVDMDGLKGINDTHGHAAGDCALVELARVLQQCSHGSDVVARIGGDEFVTVGLVNSEEGVKSHVFSLQSRLKMYNEHSGKPFTVSASFGWDIKHLEDTKDLFTMIEIADQHLYEAKQAKKRGLIQQKV